MKVAERRGRTGHGRREHFERKGPLFGWGENKERGAAAPERGEKRTRSRIGREKLFLIVS